MQAVVSYGVGRRPTLTLVEDGKTVCKLELKDVDDDRDGRRSLQLAALVATAINALAEFGAHAPMPS